MDDFRKKLLLTKEWGKGVVYPRYYFIYIYIYIYICVCGGGTMS
jgi:hypothetical protein